MKKVNFNMDPEQQGGLSTAGESTAEQDPAGHPVDLPYPSRLFVETTTHCNLACSMCVKHAEGSVIGSVNSEPLIDIWRHSAWRQFRGNVLRYDYPYCSNCSVAPCDFIEKDDFEQDCYIREEPCGTCLLAMGLLHCLR